MAPQLIRFHGSYRYDSDAALARALRDAQAQLDDQDMSEATDAMIESLRGIVRHGTSLRIDVLLPALAEVRFAASDLFQTLARDAIEGAVEATHAFTHVDFFPSGGDD